MIDEKSPAFLAGQAAYADFERTLDEVLLLVAAFPDDRQTYEAAQAELKKLFQDAVMKGCEYGVAAGANAAIEGFLGQANDPPTTHGKFRVWAENVWLRLRYGN